MLEGIINTSTDHTTVLRIREIKDTMADPPPGKEQKKEEPSFL